MDAGKIQYLVHIPVLAGSMSHALFKNSNKMLWILKSQFVGNLANRLIFVKYSLFCYVDHFKLDVFLGHSATKEARPKRPRRSKWPSRRRRWSGCGIVQFVHGFDRSERGADGSAGLTYFPLKSVIVFPS